MYGISFIEELIGKLNKIIPTIATKFIEGNITRMALAPAVTTSKYKYSTKKEAVFEVPAFKVHKLSKGPETSVTLTAEDALKLYHNLFMMRRIEIASANLYKDKFCRGFCHLYSGQEAVAAGMRAAMRPQDSVIGGYRCHGWAYVMGVSCAGVLCELTARVTGCARGKGGSPHLYGPKLYGGHGIVCAQTSAGAGLALAHQYLGDGAVCFALYGDGAANQGQLYESFNMAKLWSLPCIYVCENNKYGMATQISRSAACTDYYTRGDYVPGIWVDGMDVLAAREGTRFAIEHCTSGKGPIVLEMETYRYSGHSMSDPGTSYRTREEVQDIRKKRDPIIAFKDKIIANNLVTADQIKEVETKIIKEADIATKSAREDPPPKDEDLVGDLYYKNLEPFIRGVIPSAKLKHLEVYPRK